MLVFKLIINYALYIILYDTYNNTFIIYRLLEHYTIKCVLVQFPIFFKNYKECKSLKCFK